MYYDEDLRIELPERLEKIVRDHERRAVKRAVEKERRYNIKCLLNKGMDLDDILNTFGIPKKEKKKYISLL